LYFKGRGKLKKALSLIVLLLLFLACSFANLQNIQAAVENFVRIDPAEPTHQPSYAIAIGQVVMVNIIIENAVDIYGYNFTIYWANISIVEYVYYSFHPFLEEPYTYVIQVSGSKITVYAKSETPANPVSGSGVLVTLYYIGKNLGESLISFDPTNCWLIRQDGTQFRPSAFKRGKLTVVNTKIAVEPEELSGSVGETVKANITVYNVVDLYGIEINVTWNPEILQPTRVQYQVPWKNSFELRNLTGPGWYALAVAGLTQPPDPYTGNYTFVSITYKVLKIGTTKIKFETSRLPDINANPILHAEINAIFSNIKMIEGDINHDGIVDAQDLIIVRSAYGSNPNKPNWNPNADLNNDNTIDIYDLIIVASHYGQTNP